MPAPIEDYALISDCRTGAMVSRDGAIDWLCLPRYDSPSVFGALLGEAAQGCWTLRPRDPSAVATRRYLPGTFILVTRWECADGAAEVHELMPMSPDRTDVVRRVVGITGTVVFTPRFRRRPELAAKLPRGAVDT